MTGTKYGLLAVALLVLLAAPPPPSARADYATDARRCTDDAEDPDLRIHACTRLLQSGELGEENLPIAFFNRGNAYADKGQYDRAIADYGRAIRLDPDEAVAFYNRGNAYADKGQYDRAIADFDRAIRLDPDDARAYNSQAWLLATVGEARLRDGREAVRLAETAVRLRDDGNTRDTLAAALAEAGRFAEAQREQNKAIAMARAAGKSTDGYEKRLRLYQQGRPYRQ